MISNAQIETNTHVIEKAKELGASLAGIASAVALQNSPSHEIHGKFTWPAENRSLLVLALAHEISEPDRDWWDNKKGGSPGNRRLEHIAIGLCKWLAKTVNIKAQLLPYHADRRGIFLKDAAALAGLGGIGKNNLLITPEFGPRVRFRGVLLYGNLEPTGPTDFDPCNECNMPCLGVCPQGALEMVST